MMKKATDRTKHALVLAAPRGGCRMSTAPEAQAIVYENGTRRMSLLVFGRKAKARNRLKDRALSRGLIAAHDKLGEVNIPANALGAKFVDDVQELLVVL